MSPRHSSACRYLTIHDVKKFCLETSFISLIKIIKIICKLISVSVHTVTSPKSMLNRRYYQTMTVPNANDFHCKSLFPELFLRTSIIGIRTVAAPVLADPDYRRRIGHSPRNWLLFVTIYGYR